MNSFKSDASLLFLKSALTENEQYSTIEDVLVWVEERRRKTQVKIDKVSFSEMVNWSFKSNTGDLLHDSGKFFSIVGVEIETNYGNVPSWTQPIINQPEIGFLGFITKKINGVLHFLLQAKIEPGNINFVQLSPTLQATKSNYTKVHKGKSPQYLEYFNGGKKVNILLDQLQSEQGGRFLKKRNRNIIIEVEEDIEVYQDFYWVTLSQIKALMKFDNLVNMDTRTVISGISYGTYENANPLTYLLIEDSEKSTITNRLFYSALSNKGALNTFEKVLSWITHLKSKYELEVRQIPLVEVQKWRINEHSIYHEEHKYFSVIATAITISNREVVNWSQPLIQSAQEGIIAFIIKEINGVMHFLVQAKVEAGNFDILELAPTVQCLTGNYQKGHNEYKVPFLNDVLDAKPHQIVYRSYQSEEGGRFYKEQNLNVIIEVDDSFNMELPENYCWISLNQLYTFIQFNNYLNIQARSLIAAISFK